jgi:integrase-like protein
MMRDDNLLAIQPKRFVVTTNSKHKCEVYLNLAGRMTLTGVNQLWVVDITYVRLKGEFVYLAVILDRFSRKVVGWAVNRTLMSSRLSDAFAPPTEIRPGAYAVATEVTGDSPLNIDPGEVGKTHAPCVVSPGSP